jgi:hypothetical protein
MQVLIFTLGNIWETIYCVLDKNQYVIVLLDLINCYLGLAKAASDSTIIRWTLI